jgi:hypothetical protein
MNGQVVDSVTLIKSWIPYSNIFAVTDATGASNMDGSATATTSGQNGPFSYSWSNGDTTSSSTGLNPGIYTMTVTDAFGCARTDSVEIGLSVAVSEKFQSINVTVAPNPFENVTHISFPNRKKASFDLQIMDARGRLVQEIIGITGESVTVNLSGLKRGLYFYRLSGKAGSSAGKLVLQ